MSVASDGTEGNSGASSPSISADGRYIAFESAASNLLGDFSDNNQGQDSFVYDQQTGQTWRISAASDGSPSNAGGQRPVISADGRYVAFWSGATNLVANDTNGMADVFVRDRQTGLTTLISVASDGTQGNEWAQTSFAFSADGRYVAFISRASNLVSGDTNNWDDVFVHDRLNRTTERVSGAIPQNCVSLSMSADGRLIVVGTNTKMNLIDRLLGQTSPFGTLSMAYPDISADGRFVVFFSNAEDLVTNDTNHAYDVFLLDYGPRPPVVTLQAIDREASKTTGDIGVFRFTRDASSSSPLTVEFTVNGTAENGIDYSSTPASVTIPSDVNSVTLTNFPIINAKAVPDKTVTLTLKSIQGVTDTRRYSAGWPSTATVIIRGETVTRLASVSGQGIQGNLASSSPSLSADGRYVAFVSEASNLVAQDTNGVTDVFLRDRFSGQTELVSMASDGTQGNAFSGRQNSSSREVGAAISGDGRFVAFVSAATNLISGDTNRSWDIFVYDRTTHTTTLASAASNGTPGNARSQTPAISQSGRFVAFASAADNLVENDNNGIRDIFMHDFQTGATELISVNSDGSQAEGGFCGSPAINAGGRFVAFVSCIRWKAGRSPSRSTVG